MSHSKDKESLQVRTLGSSELLSPKKTKCKEREIQECGVTQYFSTNKLLIKRVPGVREGESFGQTSVWKPIM